MMLAATMSTMEGHTIEAELLEYTKLRLIAALSESLDEMTYRRVIELTESGNPFDMLLKLAQLQTDLGE